MAGRIVCMPCWVVWKKSNPRHISRYGGVGCVHSPQSHSGLCSWGFTYLPPCPDAKSLEDLEYEFVGRIRRKPPSGNQRQRIKKAPYGAFFAYSISSGSSERIIPVLSAYKWSPEKNVTPPKLTRTSLSPMPSPAAPTGIAAIA